MDDATKAKYSDVLVPFVALMEAELHANAAKGDRPGWLRMDPSTALLEIYWHVAKLSAAVKNDDMARVREHSADVANMAMMLLDVCGGLIDLDTAAQASKSDKRAGHYVLDAPIHELLLDWRLYRKLKQIDVSDVTGVAPSQISQWESGRCSPNVTNFIKLAVFYAGSVDVFLRGEPRPIAKGGA